MGVRFPSSNGFDKMVDQLIQVEKIPIEQAKKRKEKVVDEKKEVGRLQKMLDDLDKSVNVLKTKEDFYHLKVESSHPDIIEGTVKGAAPLGTYEFEVRGLARADKQLAYGFPDKDETPVGFGYMEIEREDMEPFEITVEPGATLTKVSQQINDARAGVRAMIINTGYKPEPYRLLVVSEKSGVEATVNIDEDTTFLEFKNQVAGRNLDVLFEDVPITAEKNVLDELLEGVNFRVKRSEPGTRVQVSIVYDMDATIEAIKSFVSKYNDIVKFANEQSKNPNAGEPGKLAGDGAVRQVMRGLQTALFGNSQSESKFQTLADCGITTNPKSGELNMDEPKVRGALADDYDGVADVFIRSRLGVGVADRIAEQLRSYRDPESGVIRSRLRGLDRIIENQDQGIQRRERQLADKEESIKRRFSSLEGQMANLQQQGNFLAQRFGAGQAAGPQGGG